MSNITQQFKSLLEKENSSLDAQLHHYEKDNEEKLKQIAEVQNELLTQLLENHTEAERAIVYQKLIDKKEQDIKSYEESSRKKLALVDDLVKKHQNTMSIRSDLRDRSITTLKRMIIADEYHFGNMRIFRADTKAKRSKIAVEITEARNELAEKKKQFDMFGESLKQVYCVEISPFIKREISEECQNILKEGRKRLLALKMENRALWMKLNHNV